MPRRGLLCGRFVADFWVETGGVWSTYLTKGGEFRVVDLGTERGSRSIALCGARGVRSLKDIFVFD